MLDVAVLVLAVRHFGERQVRDRRQTVFSSSSAAFASASKCRQRHLQLVDLGHQLLRRGLVLLRLGCADLLRRRVPARLGLLGLQDRGAAALVDGEQPVRLGREAAPRQAAVELVGVFANPSDVVHVVHRFEESARPDNVPPALLANASPPGLVAAPGAPSPFFRFPTGGMERRRQPHRLRSRRTGRFAIYSYGHMVKARECFSGSLSQTTSQWRAYG